MPNLGVALYENFELLDVYGPLEMFGSLGDDIEISMLAEHGDSVRSTQGPRAAIDATFDSASPQWLLVPGGVGTLQELGNDRYLEFLRRAAAEADIVMSVCSGSALLAKAGLLDGRRATSNKMFFALATSQSDRVHWVDAARWVEDGKFVTSSGVSAGIDMALAVISRQFDEGRAIEIANMTEYQWHRDPNSDPFSEFLNRGAL